MKLKYRLGDFISIIVIVLGVLLELAPWPYGKSMTYAGFLLLGIVHLYYYSIDLKNGKAKFPDWKQSPALPFMSFQILIRYTFCLPV
jgi:hypothetical protein